MSHVSLSTGGATVRLGARTATPFAPAPLADRLRAALDSEPELLDLLVHDHARDERDELLTLAESHALWLAPIGATAGREQHQGHPAVAALKSRLEARFIDRIEARAPSVSPPQQGGAVAAVRRIAATGLVPPVYRWLADEATWDEFLAFIALEGGPDAGFDDLVALVQVGISGGPKVALATNYWDELGRGDLDAVHATLHEGLVAATGMEPVPARGLPVAALERAALSAVLVTNRRFQPEAIGALGLLELQAGPRCRAVLRALDRLGGPPGARPFYEEHAVADPRHGKDWLDHVVAPLAVDPHWAAGIVRGAHWRHIVNHRFFAAAHQDFATAH